MDIGQRLAQELGVKGWQTEAAIGLIDQGNTIPFIARYRKEATGSLDDGQLRTLHERLLYLRNLEERKAQVLAAIEEQGKLTEALKEQIHRAEVLVEVEDLYRPYRPKRRTRATIARERGLEGLAHFLWDQRSPRVLEEAARYVNPEKEVATPEEALAGAGDILAEVIADQAPYRARIREMTEREGLLISRARDPKAETVYEMYYDFQEPLSRLAGHRILALNRGEKEKHLTVSIQAPEETILSWLKRQVVRKEEPETARLLEEACQDGYRRLMAPSLEREIRNSLTERAQEGAIRIFGKNLQQLLLQPPVPGQVVLGWDPAFRTGCKLAVVDPTGKVLETAVIYPTAPTTAEKVRKAKEVLGDLMDRHQVSLISLGNGTASRESQEFLGEVLRELPRPVRYVIVNEAGASVYSASKLAAQEFPNFDVGQRSAASIARRLQDPLAELVKIDPRSIGVGQYQHDMDQKRLGESLEGVVEACVNRVGVDLNTASAPLLSYISGITSSVAKGIVAYREDHGAFRNRRELLKVPKLGPKAFQQCAGFLRISQGEEPLDGTAVHPESYPAAKALLGKLGYRTDALLQGGLKDLSKAIRDPAALARELGIGEPTLVDIVAELEKPGRDPRREMEGPILRRDVLEMKDLKEGMVLKGTVRNITDFGVFVDIGVHQDGLVHISELSKGYVKHPLDVVQVGDIVEVRVLGVDVSKKRISLSMREV